MCRWHAQAPATYLKTHTTYTCTSTPTTAETRHQTRDTKKQRQQQPDGSNKTAKRGRWHIDGAMAAVSNPEGDEAEKEEVHSR